MVSGFQTWVDGWPPWRRWGCWPWRVLVQDLAPPTDYDGLLYHLVAPQAFLQAGRIVYLPHNFSANLPALGELLFAFGLAGGSDRAPQLIHALAGGLAVGLTYTFGARLFGPRAALWGGRGVGGDAPGAVPGHAGVHRPLHRPLRPGRRLRRAAVARDRARRAGGLAARRGGRRGAGSGDEVLGPDPDPGAGGGGAR